MRVKFKTWYSEEINLYELVDSIVRGHFITSILKVLYEYPNIKREILKVIEYFEKFYSSKLFEEDKYYLERLKALRELVLNVDRIEKYEKVYVGYSGDTIFCNYLEK